MVQAELNQLVNAHDRMDECQRRVCGYGLSNVYEISSQESLMSIAGAANQSMRRTRLKDGTRVFIVKYRGLSFVYRIPSSSGDVA